MAQIYDAQGKSATDFVGLLEKTTIHTLLNAEGDYWKQKNVRPLITLEAHDTVEQAIEALAQNGILSAPVQDAEEEGYMGFLSMNNVLSSILRLYSEAKNPHSGAVQWSDWCENEDVLAHRGVRFAIKPASDILDKNSAMCTVEQQGTLFQLMEDVFSYGQHRALVLHDNPSSSEVRADAIISQTDIMHLLAENMGMMGNYAAQTIDKLNLYNPNVISMSEDALAIHAFYLMMYNKVSAVAIVDSDGKLVANLSASDLRGFRSSSFPSLILPVRQFLAKIGQRASSQTPICISQDASLETLILKLSMFQIHRLWIVDASDHLIGVASLTDIMKHFASLAESNSRSLLPPLAHDTELSMNVHNTQDRLLSMPANVQIGEPALLHDSQSSSSSKPIHAASEFLAFDLHQSMDAHPLTQASSAHHHVHEGRYPHVPKMVENLVNKATDAVLDMSGDLDGKVHTEMDYTNRWLDLWERTAVKVEDFTHKWFSW